jgi:hypothetical protein
MRHFSIRELLWLTLVVALALGWGIREGTLGTKVDRATQRANKWRGATGALERVLKDDGWTVTWKWKESEVDVFADTKPFLRNSFQEPSADEE